MEGVIDTAESRKGHRWRKMLEDKGNKNWLPNK